MTAVETRSLTIDGHRLHLRFAGDPADPPILMIHGWLSYGGVWKSTFEALSERYHCVAVDSLGLGESDKPDNADYGIPAHAERILKVADALGLDKFSLIGHSMGGQIALYIAAKLAPERVVKLVDVAGVVTGKLAPYVEWIVKPRVWLASVMPSIYGLVGIILSNEVVVKQEFRTWFYRVNDVPFDLWATDRVMAYQKAAAKTNYLCGRGIAATNLAPYLHEIKAPTLVIFGKEDDVVPVPQAQMAAERISGAKLVLIDACGHFPMYEKPAAYLTAVKGFFA